MRLPTVRRRLAGVLCLISTNAGAAEEPLDAARYVEIVARAHPGAAQAAGLSRAAAAERQAARLVPDPVLEHSRAAARPAGAPGRFTETGWSVSQTIPWPGTFGAGLRAGERAADALRVAAESVAWELRVQARRTFARLVAARALLEIARAAEGDARSLRDLVARRADLGEARESDRIKATVEWLREQRRLAAAERAAETAEAALRVLAVEPLPRPLTARPEVHPPLPPLDTVALAARLVERGPRLRLARAEAERQAALLRLARRARWPDLDLTVFRETEVDQRATGFRLGVKLPLWHANRGEIARVDAGARLAVAAAETARVELLTELQARFEELQVAADQAALLDGEVLPAASRNVALVRLSFEEGETSLLDLLDAQRTLRDAQREAVEARLALALALAEVRRLAGPDFDPWS